MNDLDLRLEVVLILVMSSCQPLGYIRPTLNISETVRDRSLVPNDHQ